ncbi:MAG: hypothetical protein J0L82_10180 [Deltaproteobacteria bacterium]|nr:hypothetical protein [Deltaproteobacteria bacterium]
MSNLRKLIEKAAVAFVKEIEFTNSSYLRRLNELTKDLEKLDVARSVSPTSKSRIDRICEKVYSGDELSGSDWRIMGRSIAAFENQTLERALKAATDKPVAMGKVMEGLLKSWHGGVAVAEKLKLFEAQTPTLSSIAFGWGDLQSARSALSRIRKGVGGLENTGPGIKSLVWLANVLREPSRSRQLAMFTEVNASILPEIRPWLKTTHRAPVHIELSSLGVEVALEVWNNSQQDKSAMTLLDQVLAHPEIGDPRGFSRSIIWSEIEKNRPELFRKLLVSLNRGDIEFFFSKLKGLDRDRKNFWINYTDQMLRTQVILRRVEMNQLAHNFPAGSEERAIIDRAYVFAGSSQQNLLVFYFGSCVAVEAGETGQACFIYDRRNFESIMERTSRLSEASRQVQGTSQDFNDKSLIKHRQIHHPPGVWQRRLDDVLAHLGVTSNGRAA